MKTFKINGQEFNSVELDMNFFCDIEEKFGISKEQFLTDTLRTIRVYVAMCGDITLKEAGKLVEQHLINGNDLEEVGDIIKEEIDNSGFIKWITEGIENTQTTPKSVKSNAKK